MSSLEGCNLCGDTCWETLEQTGDIRVVRCACGLVFVTPQPFRAALEQRYDAAYYQPWAAQAHPRAALWRRRLDRIARLAAPPGHLLDVGCGTGEFLGFARESGWEVTGTELSPYAADATGAAGLPVFAGEVWEAGFPPARFDVVTCWHVIEHVSDPRRVVAELFRVLRPGGYCLLATPNLDDRIFRAAYALARGRRARLYETEEREVHLYFFSARTLGELAKSAGFEMARLGFDRGAAVDGGKRLINEAAFAWFRLTGVNWGMGLELIARRPFAPQARTDG